MAKSLKNLEFFNPRGEGIKQREGNLLVPGAGNIHQATFLPAPKEDSIMHYKRDAILPR